MVVCKHIVLLAALLYLLSAGIGHAAKPQPLFGNEEIPAGYDSYSSFLICNPSWLVNPKSDDVQRLYDVFTAFGRALGPRNLAIWFWNAHAVHHTSDELNIDRDSWYCVRYNLLPSNSPYILVTRTPPDAPFSYDLRIRTIPDHYLVSLNGLSVDSITRVVTTLTDQKLISGLNQSDLDATAWWQRLLAATGDAIAHAGCYFDKVSFSVKTEVINAEVAHSSDRC